MRDLSLRRLRDDEGATAIIVAISLIAIFAMLMLTVDVGGLLYKRRSLVNGADAAALAAAQSCASTTDTTNPEDQADAYAASNVSGVITSGPNIINGTVNGKQLTVGCDAGGVGRVTVRYSANQQLFFAQALGFGGSKPVSAQATATFGPIAGGFALPVVLDSGTLQGACDVPDGIQIDDTCAFWYDNGAGSFGNGAWGYLNLDQWNVLPNASCPSSGSSNRRQYIVGGYPTILSLNGNPPGSAPTYVCVDTGHSSSNWSDLADQEGQIKLFPVNDCNNQIDKTGGIVGCGAGSSPDKFDIIGFTSLLIQHVYKGNDSLAIGTPGPSGTCSTSNSSPKNWTSVGQFLDLDTISSATNGWSGCPTSLPADAIANVVLTKDKNSDPACCTLGVDYSYDSTTHIVTWLGATPKKTKISFGWSFVGTTGACPGHSSDPNAVCLVTQWKGFTTGPGPIGGGTDFGTHAVRLCDLAVASSCP